MISIALSFIGVLSRCYCDAISHGLEMLLLISSYDQSCQGEKKSRTLPSSLLKEISWKWCHMPELEGFPWRILGVWLSPSGCLETPQFSFKRCKSCCTLRSVLEVLGSLRLGWLPLLQQRHCASALGAYRDRWEGQEPPRSPADTWAATCSYNMSLLFLLTGQYYVLHLKLIELFCHSSTQKQRS